MTPERRSKAEKREQPTSIQWTKEPSEILSRALKRYCIYLKNVLGCCEKEEPKGQRRVIKSDDSEFKNSTDG